MSAGCIVVDANIAFKSLLAGRGDLRESVGIGGHPQLFAPHFLFIELFKHKERLLHASQLSESDLLTALHTLLNQLTLVHEQDVSVGNWMEAWRLCKGVDSKDTPYVALTLHLAAHLWSEDEELKTGLRARGFDRFFTP